MVVPLPEVIALSPLKKHLILNTLAASDWLHIATFISMPAQFAISMSILH
jgi:hypothetical protein